MKLNNEWTTSYVLNTIAEVIKYIAYMNMRLPITTQPDTIAGSGYRVEIREISLFWSEHIFGSHPFIELFLRQVTEFQGHLLQRRAFFMRRLGYFSSL